MCLFFFVQAIIFAVLLKKLLLIFLLLSSLSGFSQGVDTTVTNYGEEGELYRDSVWIITGKRGLGPLFNKWRFDFVLDARNTFVSTSPARLLGIRLGMEYRRVHRFGIGVYNLGSGAKVNAFQDFDIPIQEAIVELGYSTLFYERVLYFHRKWEWSTTVHLGNGTITGKYLPKGSDEWIPLPERNARILEFSTTGYYNLTWWCNIGAGVGYRVVSGLQQEVKGVYSAPVAIARVRIRLGKLVQSIWDRDKKYEY